MTNIGVGVEVAQNGPTLETCGILLFVDEARDLAKRMRVLRQVAHRDRHVQLICAPVAQRGATALRSVKHLGH